jgi:hypothetical protein
LKLPKLIRFHAYRRQVIKVLPLPSSLPARKSSARESSSLSEADRPIWQCRAGAIPKVRRRRPRGGAAWPRGRREAAARGWTTGEAAAYPGPDGGRRLPRAREDGGGRETGNSATLG